LKLCSIKLVRRREERKETRGRVVDVFFVVIIEFIIWFGIAFACFGIRVVDGNSVCGGGAGSGFREVFEDFFD